MFNKIKFECEIEALEYFKVVLNILCVTNIQY